MIDRSIIMEAEREDLLARERGWQMSIKTETQINLRAGVADGATALHQYQIVVFICASHS